jgi:hypothetical protein
MKRTTFLGLLAFASACSSSGPGGVTTLHDLHQPSTPVATPSVDDDFYTLPFPDDVRVREDGTFDLSRYPRGLSGGLVEEYINWFDQGIHGAGTNSAIYFRFDGTIDDSTLPADVNASVADGATAFVVDVTPNSPTFGQKRPVRAHYVDVNYDFIGPHWVALLPFAGVPLREKTTYAAVLTDGIHDTTGKPVHRDHDLDAALAANAASSSDPQIARAGTAYAPLVAWLKTQPGLADHVVNATVFTTGDFTQKMFKLRDAVYAQAPAPTLSALSYDGEDQAGVDDVYSGTYPGPNFQSGTAPYKMPSNGGAILYNANGVPQMDHVETLRVAMTIPKSAPMPAAGWPVVIYAHGTGGDYKSFIGDGSGREVALIQDASGQPITRMAMISIDQVLHGPRSPAGTDVELAYFNLFNLPAFLDNVKQGALDDFQLLRLVKVINVAAAPTTNAPIKFDTSKIYFKGHSQGGQTGPLFVAAEPEVKAAVFSGAGGVVIEALLNKTQPVNIVAAVQAPFQDPVDEFHPVLSLAQNYAEESDPENYAKYYFREPPAGFASKPIYQSLGIVDHYTPIPTMKALAMAMGVQPIGPMIEPIDGLDLAGLSWGTAPTMNNVGGGQATGVLLEYTAPMGDDGHFVVFDVDAAVQQSNRFLGTHAVSGVATLTTP